jgi:hypothetical protein
LFPRLSSSRARTSLSVLPPDIASSDPSRRFPVVDLVGQRGAGGEQQHPGSKRCRTHAVVDERGDALLDVLPFEREDHQVVAE